MSKRKKVDPSLEEEADDDDDNDSRGKHHQQQPPQKVYDFFEKKVEVHPERLLELNRQFNSSISSQITAEPYSVLVGNCLDYVRQYFKYEDDLLQHSPWLATRLKQSRSDIVKCLQETIDVYEALARQDFDYLFDKNNTETSSSSSSIRPTDDLITNKTNNSAQSIIPSFQFRPPPATTTAATTTTTSTPTTIATATPTATPTTIATTTTTTANSSLPLFSFTKPTTTSATNDSIPSTGFNFKMPTTTASPEKTTNSSPFAFSMPNTGFGTSTFSSPSFGNPTNTEKSSTSLASSISFATPPKFSFAPTTPSVSGEQAGTTEDNEDEPSEPPEPEKVDHETDAKLTYRCRMGVNKGGKLIKRGPVQVVLKQANEKHQLIVRSDDTLGRLYLNIIWSKGIEMKKNSTKDLTFVCKLNPGMPEIKEGEFVMILLRFDNETDRNDAYEKLDKERIE